MTEHEQQWETNTRAQYYADLLASRCPESVQQDHPLAELALEQGAEAVLRTVDALQGFETPDPTPAFLGAYAVYSFYRGLSRASAVQLSTSA